LGSLDFQSAVLAVEITEAKHDVSFPGEMMMKVFTEYGGRGFCQIYRLIGLEMMELLLQ